LNAQSAAMKHYVSDLAAVINKNGNGSGSAREGRKGFGMKLLPLMKKTGYLAPATFQSEV